MHLLIGWFYLAPPRGNHSRSGLERRYPV